MNDKEHSDTAESIERASRASGAKGMLDDLANKMRVGGANKPKLEYYFVKTTSEIPKASKKVEDVLMKYVEKVRQKKMYYAAHDQKWYPFDSDDKDKERGEIDGVIAKIQRLNDRPPKDVVAFNESVKFVWKNQIMGGME